MTLAILMLAGMFQVAPPPAATDGVCDQITGTYVDGRMGTFNGDSNFIAFDRLELTAGVGTGHQVVTSGDIGTATHVLLRVERCTPLSASTARLEVASAVAGQEVFSGPSIVEVAVYDGGERLWARGTIPGAELPGWLLRVPAPPTGT